MLLTISYLLIGLCGCSSKSINKMENAECDEATYNRGFFTGSTNGYYILDSYRILFYDKSSKKLIPLCSKPECDHEDSSVCNSFVGNIQSGIQYYKGKIYYLTKKGSQLILDRKDADGGNLEEVAVLTEAFQSTSEELKLQVNGNYAFVITYKPQGEESIQSLYVKDITNNSEMQKIYEAKYLSETIKLPYIYGNKAYFTSDYFGYENDELIAYGNLNCYDFETGESSVLAENADGAIVLQGDTIYFGNHKGEVHKFDIKTSEDTVIINMDENNKYFYLASDQKYLYVDNVLASMTISKNGLNGRCIYVYSHDGELIDTIALPDNDNDCINILGDSDNIVLNGPNGMELINKDQIGTGKYSVETIDLWN